MAGGWDSRDDRLEDRKKLASEYTAGDEATSAARPRVHQIRGRRPCVLPDDRSCPRARDAATRVTDEVGGGVVGGLLDEGIGLFV